MLLFKNAHISDSVSICPAWLRPLCPAWLRPLCRCLQVNGPNLPTHSAGLWGGGAASQEEGVGLRTPLIGREPPWPPDLWPPRPLSLRWGKPSFSSVSAKMTKKKKKDEEHRAAVSGRGVIGLHRRLFTDLRDFFFFFFSCLPLEVSYTASVEIPSKHGGGGVMISFKPFTAAVSVIKKK